MDRVLARNGLVLAGSERPARSVKTPWPEWCEWRPNQLWCWDGSQFEACVASKYAYGIIDLVSRKWVATILTPEPTATSAQVLFTKALDAEGLLTSEIRNRLDNPTASNHDIDDELPLLLAISDNGTEMRAKGHAQIHGAVLNRSTFRASRNPDRSGLDRIFVGPHQT